MTVNGRATKRKHREGRERGRGIVGHRPEREIRADDDEDEEDDDVRDPLGDVAELTIVLLGSAQSQRICVPGDDVRDEGAHVAAPACGVRRDVVRSDDRSQDDGGRLPPQSRAAMTQDEREHETEDEP